jgi:hypothetical protein
MRFFFMFKLKRSFGCREGLGALVRPYRRTSVELERVQITVEVISDLLHHIIALYKRYGIEADNVDAGYFFPPAYMSRCSMNADSAHGKCFQNLLVLRVTNLPAAAESIRVAMCPTVLFPHGTAESDRPLACPFRGHLVNCLSHVNCPNRYVMCSGCKNVSTMDIKFPCA